MTSSASFESWNDDEIKGAEISHARPCAIFISKVFGAEAKIDFTEKRSSFHPPCLGILSVR